MSRGIFPLPFALTQIKLESFFLGSTDSLAVRAKGGQLGFAPPNNLGARQKRAQSPCHALPV